MACGHIEIRKVLAVEPAAAVAVCTAVAVKQLYSGAVLRICNIELLKLAAEAYHKLRELRGRYIIGYGEFENEVILNCCAGALCGVENCIVAARLGIHLLVCNAFRRRVVEDKLAVCNVLLDAALAFRKRRVLVCGLVGGGDGELCHNAVEGCGYDHKALRVVCEGERSCSRVERGAVRARG